ncbi:hypothetical protein OOZ15_14870 [Galbibacter sp. EGI 63066]|uniref:hypothetical protein n=1 Tax=Galbibacter sp. EGI 63066 TaxID=2993559 RepID=UPI0022490A7F|nr:hypothetical protein [Galbibacter sp. EGI 63066]MCX2681232.1 hypothetical protein [Galbibacter sp. EGI 63066]
MKEQDEKHLEELTDRWLQHDSTQFPTADFRSSVMLEVERIKKSEAFVYKPLISKITWVIIAIVLAALTIYILQAKTSEEESFISTIDFDTLFKNVFSQAFFNLKVSDTVIYAIYIIAIMIGIQIPVLKHHFNKRLKY